MQGDKFSSSAWTVLELIGKGDFTRKHTFLTDGGSPAGAVLKDERNSGHVVVMFLPVTAEQARTMVDADLKPPE